MSAAFYLEGEDEKLVVGNVPGRKKVALSIETPGVVRPVAYFINQLDADDTVEMIRRLTGAQLLDEEETGP